MAQNRTPAKTGRSAPKGSPSRKNTAGTPAADGTSAFFVRLMNIVASIYLVLTTAVLPLYMDRTKYTAITAAKSRFFSTTSVIVIVCMIVLLTAAYLYTIDPSPGKELRRRRSAKELIREKPLLIADIAIVAYWVLMLISCLLSDDRKTAFYGLEPRDNGFFYQTLYVAAYFIISRAMKPARWKAAMFVWGGAIFAFFCITHYYGLDIYDVVHYATLKNGVWKDGVLDSSYTGPFWNSTSYRFLGPVGNVNLGSYILSVALVIAAGLYITGVQPGFLRFRGTRTQPDAKGRVEKQFPFEALPDKHGISLIVCFAVILFAELNINTDAGLVALAAAVVTIPIVLCGTLDRLCRALVVFAAAAFTVLADSCIDTILRKDEFGTTFKALLLITLVLIALAVVAMLVKNREKVRRFATTKRLRTVMTCFVLLAVIGGITLSLVITQPDEPAAGALSGAAEILSARDLNEKSDTIIHELGQMLRGNFDDRFGHNRLFTWKRTLSLIKYNPVFGIGPDNFPRFFAEHYRAEAQKMFPASNGNLDKAHNEFLDVLLDNGIIGLIAYLAFFGALLWCCFRNVDRSKYAPVFGVTVVSYMAHAFFGYQLPIHSPVIWIMIGTAGAFVLHEHALRSAEADNN